MPRLNVTTVHPYPLAALALLAGLLSTLPSPVWAHGTTRYDNGLWFDGESFVTRVVYSRDGFLRSAIEGEPDRTVDLAGGYVIPALGNAHTHALGGGGYTEEIDGFLRRGVFYAANPNNLPRLTDPIRPSVNVPGSVDVIYANGGITGPGGHPIQIYDAIAAGTEGWSSEDMNGQAYHVVDSAEALARVWPAIEAGRPDFVKVYLEVSEEHSRRRDDPAFYGRRGLDPALLPAVVERAHRAGLRVVVHGTSRADVVAALEAGADALAHLPLERLDPADARRAAQQGTVFTTTLVSHRSTDGFADIEAVHQFNLDLLREYEVPLVLGTDSHRTLIDEIDEVARLGNFSNAEILRLAARQTSRWILPERSIGELGDGFEATFLVLEGDPLEDLSHLRRIAHRVQRGHDLQIAEKAPERPGIAQEMANVMMRDGLDAALELYLSRRRDEPDAWDFSEPQLNALGYQLLQHGRGEAAVRIFELNVEQFPESANVYDSLGEGLLRAGRIEAAIENYEHSLRLNPHNDNARAKLVEMRSAAGDGEQP